MPEERLLKISPQNLLRQKEAQLAASLKNPEGETNKKTEVVVVKKKSDSEVGKSKKGKEANEESEAKTLVERPVRGTKRPGSGLEVAIREVRLDMPRMKRLKSRTTSESSQSSREEEEARVRRRPLRAAALPKVEELEKEVRKEVVERVVREVWKQVLKKVGRRGRTKMSWRRGRGWEKLEKYHV